MIKLTLLSGQPAFFRPEAIQVLMPAAVGCTVYALGVNSPVRESVMAVNSLIRNAEKRGVRKATRTTAA